MAPRLGPARDVGDVVADPGRAEIQALGGEPVMPFVEPFRGQPFGGIFVLGAGGRAGARRAPTRHPAATANLRNTSIRGSPDP